MEEIFPSEIIGNSAEKHFSKFSTTTNALYYFVIFIVAISFILLFFIKTEITVSSRGHIRSSLEPVPITVPVNAEITRCIVQENRFVNRGDTLLWFDKNKYDERIDHLNSLIDENNSYLKDINLLLKTDPLSANLKTELFQRSRDEFKQQVSEIELNIDLLQKSYDRAQLLFEKKVIPQADIEEIKFRLVRKKKEKDLHLEQTLNKWQQSATQYNFNSKGYKNEINELKREIGKYYLLAPYSGYITNYNGVLPGNFVTPGQVIGIINPIDSLVSEHLVPPKDIGYLKPGMQVIFQIDAYNYHQWGLATGCIEEISKETYIIENFPFFRVRCKINEEYLTLKNGFRGELKKGLTATARFRVTERTIARLFIDKTDNWLNPNNTNE